jgi:cobalt-zinc-cadmium efflux system outer membrane protein
MQEVARVQNDLASRLAAAYGQYAAAKQRAERYRTAILPNAQKAYRFSLDAFKGGQFEYLRVLQSQRAVAEANLEYLRSLSEAWRAASEIAGLLLEENWPCIPPPAEPMPPAARREGSDEESQPVDSPRKAIRWQTGGRVFH